MKKAIAMLLAAVMLLALTSFAFAEENKVLTIVAWDANTTGYLTAQKEAYEASHPGVTIEYIDVSSQDYDTKVAAMLAGGDTSDIYMVKDIPALLNWYDAGYTLNLNDYMKKANYDVSGFVGMETNYAMNGEQIALPFRSDFEILFYNKDLFDAAGVPYPTNDMSWEEYKEKALKVADPSKEIYGTHYHTWLSTAVNYTVADGVNTLIDGEYSDLAYFYHIIQDLEDAGACMPYSEISAAGLHYSGAFGNGNIAMMPMGYWYVATLINNIKDGTYNVKNWGLASMPTKEDVKAGSTFGNLTGVMINKASANQDLAWDYVAWLCGEEGAKVTAGAGNRPAWVSEGVADVMSSIDGFPTDEGSKAALLPTYVAIEIPGTALSSQISSILGEEHSAIMTREITIEEGIENMNERVQELLEK
ncbi:MAG: sugar ABC transporter substrate-binding protein [Clostridia bacterium]|jgi:multiple sugar transport system substrate-binding protein|nr:sugar ABC transporter substrate-binding protein [Clostridia bacterium]